MFSRIYYEIACVVCLLESLTLNQNVPFSIFSLVLKLNVLSSLAIVALAEEPYADHDGRGLGAEVRATGHDQGPGG